MANKMAITNRHTKESSQNSVGDHYNSDLWVFEVFRSIFMAYLNIYKMFIKFISFTAW